jgi:hypothetical protein
VARCAAVTDITVIEDAPFHADVAASRVHRWTRGDWQLLPFVCTPGAGGCARSIAGRWSTNLRRSLVAPLSLALIAFALATGAVSPWASFLLVAFAFSGGAAARRPRRPGAEQRRRGAAPLLSPGASPISAGAGERRLAARTARPAGADVDRRDRSRPLPPVRQSSPPARVRTAAAAEAAATTDLAPS